jgi:hypothetical protein
MAWFGSESLLKVVGGEGNGAYTNAVSTQKGVPY